MPWKPLPAVAFAICTYPFRAAASEDLPLQIGDNIYIIEQGGASNEWFRGYLVAPPSMLAGLTTSHRGQQLEHRVFSGIFPRNCVEVREYLGDGNKSARRHTQTQPSTPATKALTALPSLPDGEGDIDDALERRKSQAQQARRLSRALTRRKSQHDVHKKDRSGAPPLIDPNEPLPRDPAKPKPLAPVPLLRVGDDIGQTVGEPLVDEISSCLREWHDACLHDMLLSRGYDQLSRVEGLIKRVDTSRKQLMHDVMTMKELTSLREDTVWDLVAGNKLMHDEVIVRSASQRGRLLTADDSVIEMTKLQANMSILNRPPKPPVDLNMQYHVFVDVRNIVCDFTQPGTLQMYLCSKEFGEKPKPLSETYAIALPLPDTAPQTSEEYSKTLFINLSATDLGIGADTPQIYVVFKLLKDEPVRQIVATKKSHQQQNSQALNSNAAQKYGSLKGRRSMFRAPHSRSDSRATDRPDTSQSGGSDADGRSGHSGSDVASTRDVKLAKRVVGYGAIDIGKIAHQQTQLDTRLTFWTPTGSVAEDRSDESDDWLEIIRELQRSATGGFARVDLIKRFDIFSTVFASSELETLIRNNPTLLHDVHLTEKLGFSGVPTQKRSDIYLTLSEPILGRNAFLQHSKFGNVPLAQRCASGMANLQLTLEVRKGNGERIEDCIYTASNNLGHTAWRTTAIEAGEAWNQTIKLMIAAEDVPGSHIVMSIADAPHFPFALAWIPLWENDAFVRDDDHQVALYVYDEYSSSIVSGKGAYLALPPWHDKKNDPSYGTSATVAVRTYLSSTEYSQDPNLLGLLNWRDFHGQRLVELLERFSFVPEIEVVKLLEDVFEALFEILHEYANSEAYENIIFYNFVVILSIANDRRFNLKNVVESHAKTRHDWPYASQCLLRAYQRLATSPFDTEAGRKLRATLKVGDQVLKLILETKKPRAVVLEDEHTNGDVDERHENFEQDLQNLFVALMALMRNPMPMLLGTQTLIIQHFHSWLPELTGYMSPREILEIATDMLDACAHAQGKLSLYRLVLIINCSHLDVFKSPEVRTMLIANTFRWLNPYWGENERVTDQWRYQVRLCCSVVAAQMEELGEESCQYVPKLVASYAALEKLERTPKKTFSMLFPTSFPFPYKTTTAEVDVDEAMLEISALLAAALTTQRRLYFDVNEVDVPGVLLQALKVGQSILSGGAFPNSWLSLRVSHHRYAMSALERISEVLIDSLPDAFAPDMSEAIEFDTELWQAFFEALFLAVSSPALAMETFPEQKRRAIWKIAGDVRETGAQLIRRSWDAIGWDTDLESRGLHGFEKLGGYQVQFVPGLVAPIVELCLSVHASLRHVAVEVLRTMIISTWEIDQDLAAIQSAMIDCLDKLCRTKQVTESMLQKTFIDEMVAHFRPLQRTIEDSLYNAVIIMFGRIEELLGMLTNVHQTGTVNEMAKIVDTLRLMEFLKDVQSEDAYIRYVHQLTVLQSATGNHTEAGLSLQMHADRYAWDPSAHVAEIAEPPIPAQTAFERKEALYFEMCQHFERGQAWQRALAAYKELAVQYETNTFDFSKLARSQRAMAGIYDKIAKGNKISPRYFRVVYRGLGCPVTLRDKEFIFEGLPTDRMANFEDRLQSLHPGARILRGDAEPDVEGQHLEVSPVSPHKDLSHQIYQRTKVSQAAREHCLMSNPHMFTTTSRQPQRDVPITDQVVEKVVYTTAETFPTLLRRSEIITAETTVLSPIQAAVERTTRKTQELLALERRVSSDEDDGGAMNRMSEELLLSVDPDSNTSVSRYRHLLPDSEQPDDASAELDPDDLDPAESIHLNPMQNALKVALLDHALAIRKCLAHYTSSRYLATRAELLPRFEATYEHELAILFPDRSDNFFDAPPSPHPSDDPVTRSSRQPADTQAGASTADSNANAATDDHANPPERRQSRLRSLLRRTDSTSRASQHPNGVANSADGEGESRGRNHRSRSRGARDRSLTRRLSFFRYEQQAHESAIAGSGVGGNAASGERRGSLPGQVAMGSLKKRLSFVKGGGMNREGDYVS